MKILVCVKKIVHPKIPLSYELYNGAIAGQDLIYTIKPADLCALEQALRLKKEHGAEVEVVSIADESVDASLRDCLAMGADKVTRLWDDMLRDCTEYDKAAVLAKAAEKLESKLILCGSGASESGSGIVPAAIAELLNIAYVGQVTHIGFASPEQLLLEQKLERGNRQEITCGPAAVISVEEAEPPGYPGLTNLLVAMEKPVPVWSPADIGITDTELEGAYRKANILSLSLPKPRAKKVILPDATASPAERLQFLISGGGAAKKSNVLEEPPEAMVEKLLSVLKDKGFLSEDKLNP